MAVLCGGTYNLLEEDVKMGSFFAESINQSWTLSSARSIRTLQPAVVILVLSIASDRRMLDVFRCSMPKRSHLHPEVRLHATAAVASLLFSMTPTGRWWHRGKEAACILYGSAPSICLPLVRLNPG